MADKISQTVETSIIKELMQNRKTTRYSNRVVAHGNVKHSLKSLNMWPLY